MIGFGGYPALPSLLAASALNIPTVLHEQNAVLGRVNRLLAGEAEAIGTAYDQIDRLKPRYDAKAVLVGNPVREEIARLGEMPFPPFDEVAPLKILVTGGSQGATSSAKVVPEGLGMLEPSLRRRLQVVQQCRPDDIERVRAQYAELGIPAELTTYIEDMAEKLADAHLMIGRAGASTIAELTAAGRPAILIPFAAATDDHQTANAREMVKAGGARAIAQASFTPRCWRGRSRRWQSTRWRSTMPPRVLCRSVVRMPRAILPIWSSESAMELRRSSSVPRLRPRVHAAATAG